VSVSEYLDGALQVNEAAKIFGLGRTVLYAMMGDGRLPYSQVGARRLISRRAIAALLAGHTKSGTTIAAAAAPARKPRRRKVTGPVPLYV
jgi:excisionase family DNA binding protein